MGVCIRHPPQPRRRRISSRVPDRTAFPERRQKLRTLFAVYFFVSGQLLRPIDCNGETPWNRTHPVQTKDITAPPAETDSQPDQVRKLRFHGTGGSLFGIHIVNMLLTGLTLGIYYFWGKVKVRNYVFSQSEFEGDRFAYHGTGKELI